MKNVLSAVELLSVNHPDSWDRFVLLLCEDSGCLGIVVIYFRKHSCSSGRDHGKGCKSSPLHPNPGCQLLSEVRPLRSPCHALCRGEVVTQAREEKAHLEMQEMAGGGCQALSSHPRLGRQEAALGEIGAGREGDQEQPREGKGG